MRSQSCSYNVLVSTLFQETLKKDRAEFAFSKLLVPTFVTKIHSGLCFRFIIFDLEKEARYVDNLTFRKMTFAKN